MNARRPDQPNQSADSLEQGHIYFFYRPKVDSNQAARLEDIQRFHVVLHPRDRDMYRLITIGRKMLPDVSETGREGKPLWGFVEQASSDPADIRRELTAEEYETATHGERHQPAARPAGEGVYAVVRHENHVHLAYALELPQEPDEVQKTFNIEKEASYVISVKNPEAPSPRDAGLPQNERVHFPADLQKIFGDRRFISLDPPELLDYKGAEILLVSAAEAVASELGIRLETEKETRASADILNDLKLNKANLPLRPLFEGKWGDQDDDSRPSMGE